MEKKGSAAISSRGASGGIGTLWDAKKYEAIDIKKIPHWTLILLRQIDSNKLVRIFNIYALILLLKKRTVGTSSGRKEVTCKEMPFWQGT